MKKLYGITLRGIFQNIELKFISDGNYLGDWILNGMRIKELDEPIPKYEKLYAVEFIANNKKWNFSSPLTEKEILLLENNGIGVAEIFEEIEWDGADEVMKTLTRLSKGYDDG
jgi:hydrogenase maturation factor